MVHPHTIIAINMVYPHTITGKDNVLSHAVIHIYTQFLNIIEIDILNCFWIK